MVADVDELERMALMAYSESERMLAVEIVRRNDGRIDTSTLSQIQAAVGKPVTAPSIRGWIKKEKNTPKSLREEKKEILSEPVEYVIRRKLDEKLEDAAHKFVDRATSEGVVDSMGGREAMTAAGIAIDKMQLLRGMPTEIIGVTVELAAMAKRKGLDPHRALQSVLNRMRELPDAPMLTDGSGVN